ncbi:MAG: hypothetical protein NTV06_05265 [candidate division Zixibacteria bacterium]|nr:hypothetical protein [candidate division Zixibacteria bacterium]
MVNIKKCTIIFVEEAILQHLAVSHNETVKGLRERFKMKQSATSRGVMQDDRGRPESTVIGGFSNPPRGWS